MAYTIAFLSDTHLGYNARCRTDPRTGFNQRVVDGYLGLKATIDQILDEKVDLVLHGGDLFHRSLPTVADIVWARRQLERLAKANIPLIGVTGNHDFANDHGKRPATAAVDDPDRGITMVTDPYRVLHPIDGLSIHAISHVGLLATDRIKPELHDGVNLLISHGAAQVPGHEIFTCVDSPGEAVLGFDVLSMDWSATLLGHYHGMGPLPGFDSGTRGQAWYAGSLLRRGFSDPEGMRGWLHLTVEDSGAITIERRAVRQRAQWDLPVIDAANQTGAQVEEAILHNLATGADGQGFADAIVRQRVINCPLAVRRGINTAALAPHTDGMLVWQLECLRPEVLEYKDSTEADIAATSLVTAGSSDLPRMFNHWFGDYAERAGLAPALREPVADESIRRLREAGGEHLIAEDPFALGETA